MHTEDKHKEDKYREKNSKDVTAEDIVKQWEKSKQEANAKPLPSEGRKEIPFWSGSLALYKINWNVKTTVIWIKLHKLLLAVYTL